MREAMAQAAEQAQQAQQADAQPEQPQLSSDWPTAVTAYAKEFSPATTTDPCGQGQQTQQTQEARLDSGSLDSLWGAAGC